MVLGNVPLLGKKLKLYPHIIPYSKFETTCIKNLNVEDKTIKIIGDNEREYLYSPSDSFMHHPGD